jgi:hypothetical protein
MRDIVSNIGAVQVVAPAVFTGNNTSAAIDLSGFGSAALVVNTGAIAGDGSFSIVLQESDETTGGSFTPVAADDMIGEFPSPLSADSTVKVGYIGNRRYVRAVLTRASGTSLALGAVLVKGNPRHAPVD